MTPILPAIGHMTLSPKRLLRGFTAFAAGSLVFAWVLSGVVATNIICHNHHHEVGAWDPGQPYTVEEAAITTHDGIELSGWYVNNNGDDRAVIWVSGIHNNRRGGIHHADFYLQQGFSVLLLDLRGTGKSQRVPVSLGWHERHDLAAAVQWLRARGHERIGAHGHSLGAATIAYSLQEVEDYSFIVLESAYDSIQSALKNRLAMFRIPAIAGWPTTVFTEWYAGVRSRDLRPVEHIARSRVPTLVLAGDAEPELPVRDTLAIYEACEAPLKRLHLFEGHRHQNHYRRAPEQWELLLTTFLIEAGLLPEAGPFAVTQAPR